MIKKFFLIFFIFPNIIFGQILDVYTTLVEPYTVIDENKNLTGVHKDLFDALKEKTNLDIRINLIPPSRMQVMLSEGKNILFFPMIKKQDRIDFLEWIFHVNTDDSQFISLKSTDIPEEMNNVKTLKDLKGITIGVLRGSIFEKILLFYGVNKEMLSYASSAKQNYDKLVNKRIDYVYTSGTILINAMKHSKYGEKELNFSKPVVAGYVYVVSSKNIDSDLRQTIENGFKELLDDGTLDKILIKHRLKRTVDMEGLHMVHEMF